MDEYGFDIQTPDALGEWVLKDASKTVTAYDEQEAKRKAEIMADNTYSRWRIKNVRMVKKFTNPDNEI